MSSQIALVATDPVRASFDRPGRSDDVAVRAAVSKVKDQNSAPDTEEPVADNSLPELKVAVKAVRNAAADLQRELQFSVDEASGRTIITVIDRESGKIIRQIPPEELLQIADRVAAGGNINLFDSRA